MSDPNCGCNNDPCSYYPQGEGVASQLQNLINALFGSITVTVDNTGRGTWSTPCSPLSSLPALPRNTGEGALCYALRYLGSIAVIVGGAWNSGQSYGINTIVASGSSLYLSVQTVPAGTALTNTAYWQLLLTAAQGPQGPQGNQGVPGAAGGTAVNYAVRTVTGNDTASNSDAVIFVNTSTSQVETIPLMSGLTSGKFFKIVNMGTGTCTFTPTSTDVVGLPGSAGTSTYVIQPGETLDVVSKNTGFWFIV